MVAPARRAASTTRCEFSSMSFCFITPSTAPWSVPPSVVKSFWYSTRTTAVVRGSTCMMHSFAASCWPGHCRGCRFAVMGAYQETYDRWNRDPEAFWRELAGRIEWEREPDAVLDSSRAPLYRWFTGGRMNTCFNAVDRHVRDGRGDQPALIYDSPVTGTQRTFTYADLQDEVARFAGVLRGLGAGKGDRVIVYLP